MPALVLLMIAIACEVVATTMLKASEGFSRPLPTLLVAVGYALSFWLLSIVVKTIPLGVAYAIWSGVGIICVSILSYFIYNQRLDLSAISGIGLIMLGVLVINLFSKTSGH